MLKLNHIKQCYVMLLYSAGVGRRCRHQQWCLPRAPHGLGAASACSPHVIVEFPLGHPVSTPTVQKCAEVELTNCLQMWLYACPVMGWCAILGYSLLCVCSCQHRLQTPMTLIRTSGYRKWRDGLLRNALKVLYYTIQIMVEASAVKSHHYMVYCK